MQSLLKLTYRIINDIKPDVNDDTKLKEPLIKDKVKSARAVIIKEEAEANHPLTYYYQRIKDLPLKFETGFTPDQSEYANITAVTYKFNSPVQYLQLPGKLINIIGRKAVAYLGSVDFGRDNELEYLPLDEFQALEYRMITPDIPCYTILPDNLLVVKNPFNGMKYYGGLFIFEDPLEAPDMNEESVYPFPEDKINRMEIIIKKDLLSMPNVIDPIPDKIDTTQQFVTQEHINQKQNG